MKLTVCPLSRRWPYVLGAVALMPLVVWTLVVLAAPTGWARDRIARRLSQASGRTVRLDRLELGWLGGVSLDGLTIGAPASADDPWLSIAETSIDVGLRQLVCGQVEPTEVEVKGLTLRVLRRADGTLELSDFLRRPDAPARPEDADEEPESGGVSVRLSDGVIFLVDEPTNTRLELRDVQARALCRGKVATLTDLTATLNGGTVALAAQIDRTASDPSFEGQLKLREVELDAGMSALAYLVPVLTGSRSSFNGRLALDLYARGRGDHREALKSSLVGHGQVTLDPIQLDGSRLLDEVARFVELPKDGRIGSVRSDLAIRDGRIATDNLTLDLARIPVVLAGWTDFEGRLSYRLRSNELIEHIPARARGFLAELDVDLERATDLRVDGTVNELSVTLDGVPLNTRPDAANPPSRSEEFQRLREIGRQLRDRIRR
ncbi:MAG: AsmA-like C-terminal region-containing protein [Isosphaeraceae bacterium]